MCASENLPSRVAPVEYLPNGATYVAHGDEWLEWEYKGVVVFETSCGIAGCYAKATNQFLGKTPADAMRQIDGRITF